MNRRRVLRVSMTIALALTVFGTLAGSRAAAAEIKVLSAVALHPAIDALIPDFENSSGHKVSPTARRAASRNVFNGVRQSIL
ncbi:hypothetical protein RSO01_87400 [Reyranella soli]|uniref:ABC transporter substrate-binding protein n=1 Tax=Reyranella soli TaxID=1230389 RepID=A0A512NRK9_9HYPH|nr:hypothetical protein RSO01_87400 [Reyranella soli]